METLSDLIFLGSKINVDGDCSHEIKILALWKNSYDKPRQCIKKQRHYISYKGPYGQSYGFSNILAPDVKNIRSMGLQRVRQD